MITTRRRQTTAPHGHGVLGLPGSENGINVRLNLVDWNYILSPYFQMKGSVRKKAPGRDKNILVTMKAIINSYAFHSVPTIGTAVNVGFFSGADFIANDIVPILGVNFDTDDLATATVSSVIAWASTNSYGTLTSNDIIGVDFKPILSSPPMIVSGVAKTGTYAVAASPVVAGGSGVARFYVDSNGDGTGTAPSEIETATLQAVVLNTTLGYVPQSITVDTNRKYVDIKMGTLSFTGVTVLGLNVLGSQGITNAANGIVVNCLVIVKQ